jgi:hypothetical protein
MVQTNVFFFNPTCELAVSNGSFSYMPPLILQEMEQDLSILPFVFATENDFVLTQNLPSAIFIQKLKDAGFSLPKFCTLSELKSMPDLKIDAIIPWGWSPAAHFKLKDLKDNCADQFKSGRVFNWKTEHQLLFERQTSLDFLNLFMESDHPEWIINKSLTGRVVRSCDEIETLLTRFDGLVIKAPMSSSGRGIQMIRKQRLNTANKQWISGILKQQNYLIAEPYLEKLTDLSFQFEILADRKINYVGYSVFDTNSNGQYKGTFLNANLSSILSQEIKGKLDELIDTTANLIGKALETSVYSEFYTGYLGVDALIFRDDQNLMIQPCIEVNCRMNMGILSKFLEDKIHPESTGKFELFYGTKGEYGDFAIKASETRPIKFKNGKMYSGFLPLSEPDMEKKFGAYITLEVAR